MRVLIGQKPMFYQSIKHRKSVFYYFARVKSISKSNLHSPAAPVFYISLVTVPKCPSCFMCNTRLRLLYLLNKAGKLLVSELYKSLLKDYESCAICLDYYYKKSFGFIRLSPSLNLM